MPNNSATNPTNISAETIDQYAQPGPDNGATRTPNGTREEYARVRALVEQLAFDRRWPSRRVFAQLRERHGVRNYRAISPQVAIAELEEAIHRERVEFQEEVRVVQEALATLPDEWEQ